MGRSACPERQHFSAGRDTPNEVETPAEIAFRKTNLQRHLAECVHAPDNVSAAAEKQLAKTSKKRKLEDEYESDGEAKADTPVTTIWTAQQVARFERLLVEFQHDNLLADLFIERPSTVRFLEMIAPGITQYLPSRRELGDRLLLKQAAHCEQQEVQALQKTQSTTGGRVNLLSDVWQNVSKTHLLGCQLALFGKLLTIGLLAVGSRHDGLAIAEQLEGVMNRVVADGWRLGSCITDDAGQCRRARDVLALRWPRVVFLRCFAHMINNLVKAVLKTCFKTCALQAAAVAVCLSHSSSKWLCRAREWMTRIYGDFLAFISLCDTRWNSMQGCFASLLRVRKGLKLLYAEYHNQSDFPSALRVLGQREFWSKLKVAEEVIRPLANASYRLQRDENTLADVVVSFHELFRGFQNYKIYSPDLMRCLEDRWKACEQPLFLLTFAIHPKWKDEALKLLKAVGLTRPRLSDFAVYYYRLLIDEDFGYIRDEFSEWLDGDLTRVKASHYRRPAPFWRYVQKEGRASKLPDLAIALLSIAVNTATCERLFSELGSIHTLKRNRLHAEKTRHIHAIRKNIRDRSSSPASIQELKIVDPEHRKQVQVTDDITIDASQASLFASIDSDSDSDVEEVDDSEQGLGEMNEEEACHTMSFWDELFEEVFDAEMESDLQQSDAATPVVAADAPQSSQRVRALVEALDPEEPIPDPMITDFPQHGNDPNFPRMRMAGFRAWSIKLEALFA